MSQSTEARLRQARQFAAAGAYEEAQDYYIDVLRHAPTHIAALVELGAVAQAGGHRTAALTVFARAVSIDPANPVAHAGLGSLLYDLGELAGAERHYRAALAADPSLRIAHQGLARVLHVLGDPAAETHLRAGFAGGGVVRQPYFGDKPGIPLLMLVSARGGNLHTRLWIDNRVYDVTAVYTDIHDPAEPLPRHALMLNAIGDADLCEPALAAAERLAAASPGPVLNDPARVRHTTRPGNAQRLAAIPGVIAPRIMRLPRQNAPQAACLGFPLLLRAPGFHTGQFFVRVESEAALAEAAAAMPTRELLAISYLDARGTDGMVRKYRVMFIDGAIYPLHLAVAADWKVHYFSAAMASDAAYRHEERQFLTDMPASLGPRAMTALAEIQSVIGLDYAGVDFAVAPDGRVLLFEANATMAIAHAGREPIWDYRRPAIGSALGACRRMLQRHLPA